MYTITPYFDNEIEYMNFKKFPDDISWLYKIIDLTHVSDQQELKGSKISFQRAWINGKINFDFHFKS